MESIVAIRAPSLLATLSVWSASFQAWGTMLKNDLIIGFSFAISSTPERQKTGIGIIYAV